MKTAKELSEEEKVDDTVWPAFTSSLNFPASTKGGARVRYSAAGITCDVELELVLVEIRGFT